MIRIRQRKRKNLWILLSVMLNGSVQSGTEMCYFIAGYFDQMYEAAVRLIKKGKAYVCDLTPEQIREYRGTLTEPGKESPYRNRSVEENLELFENMKNGVYKDGEKILRAKIDMASPEYQSCVTRLFTE